MMLLPVGRMYIRMESAMSIIVDKISYVYEAGTGFERRALDMCRVQLMTENL